MAEPLLLRPITIANLNLMMITPPKMFLGACLAFTCGIFIFSFGSQPQLFILAPMFFVGALFILGGYPRRTTWGASLWVFVAAGIFILALACGGFIYGMAKEKQNGKITAIAPFFDKEIVLRGTVEGYPQKSTKRAQIVVRVSEINGAHFDNSQASNMLVYINRFAEYGYGDILEIKGKLFKPQNQQGFDYVSYLAKDDIFAIMFDPEISVVSVHHGNPLKAFFYKARAALDKSVMNLMPQKEAAVLKAVMLGDEGDMSDAFKLSLNRAGLRHIVAVSGMNITIIASLLLALFIKLGLWRKQAFLVAALGITFFVFMIGAPASAVRAAIFGILTRLGEVTGRLSNGINLIFLAASVMLLFNPFSLRWDLGFQLSFLATLGIIIFYPFLNRLFSKLPDRFMLKETISMTFAAQILTFPLLVSSFGMFSFVSPLSNLIVIPFLVPITVAGFVMAVLNMFIPFGTILSLPLWLVMRAISFVAETLGSFGAILLNLNSSERFLLFGIYTFLAGILIFKIGKSITKPIDEMEEFKEKYYVG